MKGGCEEGFSWWEGDHVAMTRAALLSHDKGGFCVCGVSAGSGAGHAANVIVSYNFRTLRASFDEFTFV